MEPKGEQKTGSQSLADHWKDFGVYLETQWMIESNFCLKDLFDWVHSIVQLLKEKERDMQNVITTMQAKLNGCSEQELVIFQLHSIGWVSFRMDRP